MATDLSWRRLAPRESCRVCDRRGWCTVRSDGAVGCMRAQSDRPLRNGGWLHWPDGRPLPAPIAPRGRGLGPAPSSPAPVELAPIERRDAAYRMLADRLGLDGRHAAHLRDVRRLPLAPGHRFASAPGPTEPIGLVRAVEAAAGSLVGVPGFYVAGGRPRLVGTAAGILIPVRDRAGRIAAMTVRADQAAEPAARYRWLSSVGYARLGGIGSGAPPAFWSWELVGAGLWITEGALKAAAVAARLGVAAVGLAGVAGWRPLMPLLSGLGSAPVVVAFDRDWRSNLQVWRHRAELCRALGAAGAVVLVAAWDWAAGKGVDDALGAGAAVEAVPWRPSAPPLGRTRGRAPPALAPGAAAPVGAFRPAAAGSAS